MPTIHINADNFEQEVIASDNLMLIDFWAEWCGPCKSIGPSLEELSEEFAGKCRIGKINIEEAPTLAARYGVRSLPALALVRKGEVIEMKTGAAPKARIADWISSKL